MKVVICVTEVVDGLDRSHNTYSVYPRRLKKDLRIPPYGLVYGIPTEDNARAWCAMHDHAAAPKVISLGKI